MHAFKRHSLKVFSTIPVEDRASDLDDGELPLDELDAEAKLKIQNWYSDLCELYNLSIPR